MWCNSPFFSRHHKVVAQEDVAVAGATAMEVAQVVPSSSNLLNDTQYQVLPSKNPGLELTMPSGDPLHCFPCSPSSGGEDSECVNPTREGKDSVCTVPTGGGKDSVCTAPTGKEKESMCKVPSRGGENSVCTGYIQSSSVQQCTYPRKITKSVSGGQTEAVPSGVGKARLPPVSL